MNIKYSIYSKTFIFLIALMFSISAFAQNESDSTNLNQLAFGIRGGVYMPKLKYSDPKIDGYESKFLLRSTYGIFANIPLSTNISLRPELLYTKKGQEIDDLGVVYKFKPTYFDWRLPLVYHFVSEKALQPYVLIAPTLGFAYGGTIELDEWECLVTTASVAPIDFGLMAGAGFSFPIKINKLLFIGGLEATYGYGLSDTYAQGEIDEVSNALNLDEYAINGTRTNRGLAVTASITIPLSTFKSEAQKRGCYTVPEIRELIEKNKKIYDKNICVDNLNFDFDKSDITPASQIYLDDIVALMKYKSSINVRITGYTDDVGTEEYNMKLSKRRAEAVNDYLVKNGISKDRLSYSYFGESDALKSNRTEKKRAINRRVELEIIE